MLGPQQLWTIGGWHDYDEALARAGEQSWRSGHLDCSGQFSYLRSLELRRRTVLGIQRLRATRQWNHEFELLASRGNRTRERGFGCDGISSHMRGARGWDRLVLGRGDCEREHDSIDRA